VYFGGNFLLCTVFRYVGFFMVFAYLNAAPAYSDPDHIALTVDIVGAEGQPGDAIALSLADLQAFPTTQFETETIWTTGTQVFTGVLLATLLDSLDVDRGHLKLQALNDYHITMPVSEAIRDDALLAYWRNDAVMSPRKNGPLWLVYDYESDPKYRSERYYARSIWQLNHITVSR